MPNGFLNKSDLAIKYEPAISSYSQATNLELKKEVNVITSILPITHTRIEKERLTNYLTEICKELSSRGETVKMPQHFFTKRTKNQKQKFSFLDIFRRKTNIPTLTDECLAPIKQNWNIEVEEEISNSFVNTDPEIKKIENFTNYVNYLDPNSLLYNEFSYYSDINRQKIFEDDVFFKKEPFRLVNNEKRVTKNKQDVVSNQKTTTNVVKRNKNSEKISNDEIELLLNSEYESKSSKKPSVKEKAKKIISKRVLRKKRPKEDDRGLIDESYFD